ncbi:MAG: DinB family protein [Actinomycetota bacterium]|nr:DinB family protein [Actinomycetota bacterium]
MAERTHPDMWLDPGDDPRTDSGGTDERSILVDYLDNYRLTLELKCAGLDAQQMADRSVPPSTMSLLGLVRHLADVELSWFRRVMGGEDVARHFRTADDRDGDFNGAVADPDVVAEAWSLWRDEVANAQRTVAEATTLDTTGDLPEGPITLREVLVHMIEEYARHVGHADLLRECIDGRTGQ